MNCPHCKTPIDEHEANQCLDIWVAQAVMNWEPPDDATWSNLSFSPSSDIAAAWQVVEQLANWNAIVSVAWGNGADSRKYASVQIAYDLFKELSRPLHEMDGKALTAPLAICRAALKAIEYERVTRNES